MAARCGGVRARKSVRTRRTVGWCALGGAGDEIGDGVRVMLMDASIDGVCVVRGVSSRVVEMPVSRLVHRVEGISNQVISGEGGEPWRGLGSRDCNEKY
jgi:hypothetical protein